MRLFLAILISISLVTVPSFAAVKAGTKCTKAGATSTSGGKKFTCIKSGGKLVWNKGVVIKKSDSAPKSETKIEIKNLLASDSRITPRSGLTNFDVCQTEDLTPYFIENGVKAFGNGFPRPSFVINGKKSAKVLVIPMEFADLPFTDKKQERGLSDLEQLNQSIPLLEETFKNLSANKFEIKFDVLPRSEWWKIDSDVPFSWQWGVPNGPALTKIIEDEKKDFDFNDYDTFAFITGKGRPGQAGSGSAQAARLDVKNSKSGKVEAFIMVGTASQTMWWAHEIMHTLFALEDLYLFDLARTGASAERTSAIDVPTKWDLMANANKPSLLEWNRYLLGWLEDTEVRCIDQQKSSVHYLSNVDLSKDPKLLTVNISPGVTLAAEARPGAIDGSGLLLYTINSHIEQGDGPILAQNALISRGKSKSWLGWEFNVLDSNEYGVLIEAIKTDIDKFVPPPPKPPQNNPSQPLSPIRVTRGEVVPDGFLKARSTWNVTGHESYRLYITDTVDFQKVYFETGYVNDSRNPLVIEIKGLVCNKEFRTVTEFFTKKNGEGEKLVIPSLQLRNLSCEDTTKKP
jgi:hypothetical protein